MTGIACLVKTGNNEHMASLFNSEIFWITIAVFGGALLVSLPIIVFLQSRSKIRRQVKSIITQQSEETVEKKSVVKDGAQRSQEIAKKLKEAEKEQKVKKEKDSLTLKGKMRQAGVKPSLARFWILSIFGGLALGGLTNSFTGLPLPVVILITITGIFGLPRMVLKFLIGRRQKKFLEEFAEALEAMVRLLKSGMPVSEAIHMVGREFGGPVGFEMDRIYDEQRVGVTLPEAVHKAAERMPLTEMKMFATGITIQAETGSSLSEILTNLANVIRDRYRLKRKVKAMSAEAKTSAIIIGSLPLFVSGMLYLLNPGYMQPMLDSGTGRLVLYGAGVWMVIGMIVIRQMINFKI